MNVLTKLTYMENETELIRAACRLVHTFNKLKLGGIAVVDLDEDDETIIRMGNAEYQIDDFKEMIRKARMSKGNI